MKNLELIKSDSAQLMSEPFVKIKGDNNQLIMKDNSTFGKLGRPTITITGNNNKIIIDQNARINRGHFVISGDNQEIYFGPHTSVNNAYILCTENTSVRFGADCLLANDIEIRTSDAHSIVDTESGERVNHAGDVTIGDHVWIAKEVCIMPGVSIPSNTIIGMRSLVTRSFEEENTILGGSPAKVIATNRNWDRALVA